MARHERNFRNGAQEPLSVDALSALLGQVEEGEARLRKDAMACALSASEGWQEAVKRLRGTFAAASSELKERKDGLPRD